MDIVTLVNKYGEIYSPYKGKLINDLPVGQLALFKISDNIKKVEALTSHILKRGKINKLKDKYTKVHSINECLGKRKLYKACLDFIKEDLNKYDKKEYISKILNKYEFGVSSGLFHPLTRVYYGVDAFKNDEAFIDEVARGLSYYITGYREGDLFQRSIDASNVFEEMNILRNNPLIKNILKNEDTTGKRIRALYNHKKYVNLGFTINGTGDEKIKALLELLLPAFINSQNIIVFHCITGLQALVGLREYYEDYERALDILTTTIITHLLTVENLDFTENEKETLEFSWEYILSLASQSTSVHNIEIASSCRELYKIHPVKQLKTAALKKIDTI